MPELIEFNVKAKRKPITAATQQATQQAVGGMLQHGKRYVTRSGAVTGPMDKVGLAGGYAVCKHSETGQTGTWFFTNDGCYAGMQHFPEYGMHIVGEYVEPVAQPQVQPAPVPYLPLQVGKKYLCQNGKTVTITKKAVTNTECVMGVSDENQVLKYEAASGRRFAHKELAVAPWHIVSEVPKYVPEQLITAQEADELFKDTQLEYTPGDGKWYIFPMNYFKNPSDFMKTWQWRIK